MNRRGLIKIIITAGVLLTLGFFWFVNQNQTEKISCVPSSCCHATECVQESEAPNCTDIICTMDCEPNTLDCQQARCELTNGKCEVIQNE